MMLEARGWKIHIQVKRNMILRWVGNDKLDRLRLRRTERYLPVLICANKKLVQIVRVQSPSLPLQVDIS
jgi:hypothetical protein